MPATTAQKLRIKEGFILLTIHAPTDFQKKLEPLPPEVRISDAAKKYNQVHWFVKNKSQLEKELNTVLPLIKSDVTCWIYYPKVTSKIQKHPNFNIFNIILLFYQCNNNSNV